MGGVERLSYDFLNNVDDAYFDIHLLILEGGKFEDEFKKLNIQIHDLSAYYNKPLKQVFAIRKLIKQLRPAIVHTHNRKGAGLVYLGSRGFQTKLVRTFHHFGSRGFLRNLLNLYLLNNYDSNLFVSNSFKQDFIRNYKLKKAPSASVIYNGVDFKRFAAKSDCIKDELGIHEDALLIGMVGNFVSIKDQLTVCKAFKQIEQDLPKARLIFAGNHNIDSKHFLDECMQYCKQNGFEDKVFFLDSRKDVPQLLAELDLFVFSTLADTFGIALIEAMGAGVPAISSNIGPISEITEKGKYVPLFENGEVDDLAIKMKAMLKIPKEENQLAMRAQQFAIDHYAIRTHIDATLEVYKRLVKN